MDGIGDNCYFIGGSLSISLNLTALPMITESCSVTQMVASY